MNSGWGGCNSAVLRGPRHNRGGECRPVRFTICRSLVDRTGSLGSSLVSLFHYRVRDPSTYLGVGGHRSESRGDISSRYNRSRRFCLRDPYRACRPCWNRRIARDRCTCDSSDIALASPRYRVYRLTGSSGNFIRSDGRGRNCAGQRSDEIRRNCGALVNG